MLIKNKHNVQFTFVYKKSIINQDYQIYQQNKQKIIKKKFINNF